MTTPPQDEKPPANGTPAAQGSGAAPGPPAGSAAPDGGPDNRTADKQRKQLDLAADIRKTRGEVHALRNTVVDLATTISEWGPQLVDARRDLAGLEGLVDQLVLARAEADNPPVDWFHLSAADAEREWPLLGQWVQDVLAGWYQVTRAQLPDCWALHPPAFLQVAWLRTSHIEAYLEHSNSTHAAEWNTRWLDAALGKIAEYVPATRCRPVPNQPGEHLVDTLHAEQSRIRAPAGSQPPAATAAPGPAGAGQPSYGNPYANPYGPPTPPAGPPAGTAGRELIQWAYWGAYFTAAMEADIAQRRHREAQTAAEPADQEPAEQPREGAQSENTAP